MGILVMLASCFGRAPPTIAVEIEVELSFEYWLDGLRGSVERVPGNFGKEWIAARSHQNQVIKNPRWTMR